MRRRLLSGLPLILAVVSLAVLGAATPSWAHNGLAPRLSDAAAAVQKADAPAATEGASRPTSLSVAPQRPAVLGAVKRFQLRRKLQKLGPNLFSKQTVAVGWTEKISSKIIGMIKASLTVEGS
jgi:hypothetical protein